TISQSNNILPNFHFDFKNVFESFQAGLVKEYVVPGVPTGNLLATRFIISGKLRGVNYEKWVQKQARSLNVHGFVKPLNSGKMAVIASGKQKAISQFRTILKKESPKRAEVKDVIEKERKSSIKIGFEIIKETAETKKTIKKPIARKK